MGVVGALSSCAPYEYVTISGVNTQNSLKNGLVSENDTLRIEYRFSYEKGLVGVRLYNKTAEPLEVEWRKSAIIVDSLTIGFFDEPFAFSGNSQTNTYRTDFGTAHASGTISGKIEHTGQAQFIPPNSYVESKFLRLPLNSPAVFPEAKVEKGTLQVPNNPIEVKYKRLPFNRENSPSHFRSYLTFKIGKEGAQREFTIEHLFYVSEILRTNTTPDLMAGELLNRKGKVYIFHQKTAL